MKKTSREPKRPLTLRDLRFAASAKGGFSRHQIEALGIPWQARPGYWWFAELRDRWFTIEQIQRFRELKNAHIDNPDIGPGKEEWMDRKRKVTYKMLLDGLSSRGGYNRRQIEALGEEWVHADSGFWQDVLIEKEVTNRQAALFQALCDT